MDSCFWAGQEETKGNGTEKQSLTLKKVEAHCFLAASLPGHHAHVLDRTPLGIHLATIEAVRFGVFGQKLGLWNRPAADKLYRTIATSRATDRPSKSLNSVAAVSTEDIIANRAATPPGPSPSPGGVAIQIRDIRFLATSEAGKSDRSLRKNRSRPDREHIGADKLTTDGASMVVLRLTEATDRRAEGTRQGRIDPVVASNAARGSEKVT
ncbi:hypothetical protein THAOC_28272 [Thalassiosira oceanica]|uniref:Uncharacterized protein n=1 Tax=Thalassiosira oceanica TaxID=159749 RepID=K0RFD8_THAOC|nr:hypothetical protein THAOC_28272 [Thalassiosira oceanica]|eukprot:EJK52448.1 hypothetical protein THAOC_28272 [Thalassiosira oceanica]